MTEGDGKQLLHIKKYPNRRYYDTTRSCHVTLQEVHDLVVSGQDVSITDSRTGDDITNLVLMQIILEKDQPKLDIFPSSILHLMIRSNRQALRGYVDQFFTPFLSMLARSQKQFDAYMRRAMAGRFVTPMDWANSMLEAFSGGLPAAGNGSPAPEPNAAPTGENVEDLRSQLADLQRRIEELSGESSRGAESPVD
jgi:polyhydroxyalkanoate synthesis repressor PhaR